MNQARQKWLLQRAKELRRNQTPQETDLWGIIRAKRFEGLKFYRQYVVGSYIVDFCCPEKMLVVELDGSGHAERENKDQQRDKDLQQLGYRVIHVWNSDWNTNRNGVLEIIVEAAKTPLPCPLPETGRGEDSAKKI